MTEFGPGPNTSHHGLCFPSVFITVIYMFSFFLYWNIRSSYRLTGGDSDCNFWLTLWLSADRVCDETCSRAVGAMKTGVSQNRGRIGILSRCNLGVFTEAVKLTDANPHCKIHFIGVSVLTILTLLVQFEINRVPLLILIFFCRMSKTSGLIRSWTSTTWWLRQEKASDQNVSLTRIRLFV